MAELGIKITADAVEFLTTVKRTEAEIRNFHNTVRAASEQVAGMFRSLVSAVAAYASVAVFRSLADQVDDLAKSARVLGVSASDMAQLAHVANLSNVSLDTLQTSLRHLQRVLVEAASGSKEASEALARLGLSAEELKSLPIAEQLARIAEAFEGMSEAERIASAMQLFGRSGAEIIKMLGQGGDTLRDAVKETSNFTRAVGNIDTSKIEEMNDSINTALASVRALGVEFLAALAPAITTAANAMSQFLGFLVEHNNIVSIVATIVGAAVAAYAAWRLAVISATAAMTVYRVAVAAAAAVKAFFVALSGPAGIALVGLAAAAALGAAALIHYATSTQQASEQTANLQKQASNINLTQLRTVLAGTTEISKRATQALNEFQQSSERIHKGLQISQRVMAGELPAVAERKQQAQDVKHAQLAALDELRKQEATIKQIQDRITELTSRAQALREAMRFERPGSEAYAKLEDEFARVTGERARLQQVINEYKQKEAEITARLQNIEEQLATELRAIAETEANKRIAQLREETDKLLGLDWTRFLEGLEKAGAPQGAIEQLQKARIERDLAEATKQAREFAEQLQQAAQEAEGTVNGLSKNEVVLARMREKARGLGTSDELEKAFRQVEAAMERLNRAELLTNLKRTVDELRSGMGNAFTDATRKAAELQLALEAGLINANEHAAMLQTLIGQTAKQIESSVRAPKLMVKGSVEEFRFFAEQEMRATREDIVAGLIREQLNVQRQQLLAQHKIADGVANIRGAAVADID
ncbi:MAG: hypothetical protein QW793_04805 [Candidatus Caldarchaeum sp.]